MDGCRGVFKPTIEKRFATAPWAQFVHALGITPTKNNILSRRVIQGAATEYDVTLQVDGEVICHVVNLLAKDMSLEWQEAASQGIYYTSIGTIMWEDATTEGNAAQSGKITYQTAPEKVLDSHHKIFVDYRHWNQDPDTMLARYRLALDLGTSDMALVWPDPATTSISERLAKYVGAVDKLMRQRFGVGKKEGPFIVSQSWQRDADRVRRRAAGGGNSDELLRDARNKIVPQSSPPTDDGRDDHWPEDKRGVVQWEVIPGPVDWLKYWLSGKSSFKLVYNNGNRPSSNGAADVAESALTETLLSYENEKAGTWKHNLFLSYREVTKVLTRGYVLAVPPVNSSTVYILPLDSSASLWHQQDLRVLV